MTENNIYDEAFAQMGAAPLEPGETQPPKRRYKRGGGRRAASFPGVRIAPEQLQKLSEIVKAQSCSIADWVEKHINADYRRMVAGTPAESE